MTDTRNATAAWLTENRPGLGGKGGNTLWGKFFDLTADESFNQAVDWLADEVDGVLKHLEAANTPEGPLCLICGDPECEKP